MLTLVENFYSKNLNNLSLRIALKLILDPTKVLMDYILCLLHQLF